MRLIIILFLLSLSTYATTSSHLWNYKNGGKDWQGTCKTGKRQSPIDLKDGSYASPNNITLHYKKHIEKAEISYKSNILETAMATGNTIQVSGDFGYMQYGKTRFNATQIHFHFPALHSFHGKRFVGEMHIVHRNKWRKVAILTIFFREHFNYNKFLQKLGWGKFPEKNQSIEKTDIQGIGFLNGMDAPIKFYRGSYETPPCSEVVLWFVAFKFINISKKQLQQWPSELFHNIRNTQPSNNRVIEIF